MKKNNNHFSQSIILGNLTFPGARRRGQWYAIPLLLMNRLNQTEPPIFSYLSCSIALKEPVVKVFHLTDFFCKWPPSLLILNSAHKTQIKKLRKYNQIF
jgi:hypothetical protein